LAQVWTQSKMERSGSRQRRRLSSLSPALTPLSDTLRAASRERRSVRDPSPAMLRGSSPFSKELGTLAKELGVSRGSSAGKELGGTVRGSSPFAKDPLGSTLRANSPLSSTLRGSSPLGKDPGLGSTLRGSSPLDLGADSSPLGSAEEGREEIGRRERRGSDPERRRFDAPTESQRNRLQAALGSTLRGSSPLAKEPELGSTLRGSSPLELGADGSPLGSAEEDREEIGRRERRGSLYAPTESQRNRQQYRPVSALRSYSRPCSAARSRPTSSTSRPTSSTKDPGSPTSTSGWSTATCSTASSATEAVHDRRLCLLCDHIFAESREKTVVECPKCLSRLPLPNSDGIVDEMRELEKRAPELLKRRRQRKSTVMAAASRNRSSLPPLPRV